MNDNINDINYQNRPRNNGKAFAGLILLVIGGILLLRQFDYFDIPGWIWSWPTWLIVWGLYSGVRHDFRNSAWFIILFIGLAGFLNEAIPDLHLYNFIWPVAIIMVGIWIILKRNNSYNRQKWEQKWENSKWERKWEQKWGHHNPPPADLSATPADQTTTDNTQPGGNKSRLSGDDYLDAVSVFGGVKKTILSKTFRGGDIVNIFGGSEIDLTQADIDGRVVIDITQLFGGTKIIVPSHWQVVSNLSAVFAGVDDKRLRKTGSGDNNKILILEGVSIFAGIDIRSY